MTNVELPKNKALERKFISGLIYNSDKVWDEFSEFISEEDFKDTDSRSLFRICKSLLEEGLSLDAAIISARCKSSGISLMSGNVEDFIDNMLLTPLSEKATVDAAKELVILRIKRNVIVNSNEIAEIASQYSGSNLSDFMASIESKFSENGENVISRNEPINIASVAYDLVEATLHDDKANYIIKTPWPTFNEAFSGFRPKDSYCFAGRPSHGKSGALLSLAQQCANQIKENFIDGKKLPVLYLDTEMEHKEQALRWAALVADVDPYLIESGEWAKNKDAVNKIRTVLKSSSSTDNFHHVYIPGMNAIEIRSIFRRWIRKHVGKENPAIVVFDYLKITGDGLANPKHARFDIARTLDILKDEIKQNSNATFLFGAQRNRHGEDDDSSLAESDYIQQLSTFVGLIKKKTMDEKAEQPVDRFGTHALIPVKFRKLGKDGWKFENPVKINNKYCSNWINLNFHNFRFEDGGDGRAVQEYLELLANGNSGNNNSTREAIL
jgi:replicative DNA helicase|tara:strand:+ start:8123 stop:9610 length:1488 start_codon:yes stop_codon:yes gene_type:complete